MDEFSNQFKNEMEKTHVPEERLNKAIKAGINKGKTKRNRRKGILYGISAAILSLGVLFGTAFFSPALADTLAKIPVIGSIFNEKNPEYPIEKISESLKEKGYQIASVGVRYQPDKEISIIVDGTEAYLKDVQSEITSFVENELHANGYDAYKVAVNLRMEIDEEELAYQEQYEKDLEKLFQAFNAENISKEQIEIRYIDEKNLMEVWVIGTQDFYESVKDKVSEIVTSSTENTVFVYDSLEIKHSDEPLVQVISRDELPPNERKWADSRVLAFIGDELYGKTDYHVESVAHKFENDILHLNIYVSLDSSDSAINDLAKGIKQNIVSIFESESFKDQVDGLPFELSVTSKDGVKIE